MMDEKENFADLSTNPNLINVSKTCGGMNESDEKEPPPCAHGIKNRNVSEPLTTKVYYFVDDQAMPYSTEVPVPQSKITLNDFKRFITRRNYKYYCKVMDAALNAEVKAEIRDEFEVLKPNSNGRLELFLLSENVVAHPHGGFLTTAPGLPPPLSHGHHYPMNSQSRTARASLVLKRTSAHYVPEPKIPFLEEESCPEDNHLFADSNFASSLSDGDSQYTTTDFTSVSQQQQSTHRHTHQQFGRMRMGVGGPGPGGGQQQLHMLSSNRRYDGNNKPCWMREKRKRYRRTPPPSFLSSTFEDTEVSMALDLITVAFNMDTRRPFGMSVVVKKNHSFYGIVVHEVTANSLVALDGRIKPGYILLEINGIPLDDYDTPEEAVTVLSNAVKNAVENKGHLKLTCARGEVPRPVHSFFRPPMTEPVRPIDPTAWVQHTNAARGLNEGAQRLGLDRALLNVAGTLECSAAAYLADMPQKKSATIPKTSMQMWTAANKAAACDQSTSPAKPFMRKCETTGLRMVQNPSKEITTTTSAHSSLECSVGQEGAAAAASGGGGEPSKKSSGKGKGKGGGGRGHGIGSVLRRLVCIQTSSGSSSGGKRTASGRKRKAGKK